MFQIRIACKVLETEERKSESSLYDFLENCLRHKSEVNGGNVVMLFHVLHTRWWCMRQPGLWSTLTMSQQENYSLQCLVSHH